MRDMIGLETFERQSEIISIQSEIIDELFWMLVQYREVSSMDAAIFDKMKQAAEKRKNIEEET